MHFLSEALEQYIAEHSSPEPEILAALSRETHLKVLRPRMITGHFQGRVLSMISKLHQPQAILEIGTYTGYSAICLAEGLVLGGSLHTIDSNPELHGLQRRYFDLSGYGDQIIQHTGNALDIVPKLEGGFDLVFIDAEKTEYEAYLEAVLPKTRKGGLIMSDNVLWSGKVLDPAGEDKATALLQAYNKKLRDHPRLETVMLPIRDGLSLSRVL